MSYGVTRISRLRFSKFGGALVAVTGIVAGCTETNTADGGDAGDAAVGVVSADSSGDGGGGNIDTQDLSVGIDTSEAPDNLSVGLDSLADAGATSASPSSSAPSSAAPTSSSDVAVATSVDSDGTSLLPVDRSSAPEATSAPTVDTSVAPIDTSLPPVDTSAAPVETSSAGETSFTGDTSAPREVLELSLSSEASWVDLPALARPTDLPDGNFELTWTVTSVPDGSEISDASLSDPTASGVVFYPDIAGTYTLSLHVESPRAVGDSAISIDVAKVDVGFLLFSDGGDGYYGYEPKMVPSDGSLEPFDVGCPLYSWNFDDSTFWRYVLEAESSTLGFSYPTEPGGETLFAYHHRDAESESSYGAIQVASAGSDCAENRPTDLRFGYTPDFSPAAADLSRVSRNDGTTLLSSPVNVDDVSYPAGTPYIQATDWWDNSSILWSGDADVGGEYAYTISISPVDSEGSQTVFNCAPTNNEVALFDQFDMPIEKIAAVPGGILAQSFGQVWYLPVTFQDGLAQGSCDAISDGNVLIASGVADFAVAPDGRSLALLTLQYVSDAPIVYLAVGPIGEVFDAESSVWQAHDAGNPADYFTGLHWIANSQQLVWTAIQYYGQSSGEGGYYTYIYDSAVYKINADGTYPRTLAYNAFDQANERVVTTGPVDIGYNPNWGATLAQ